MQEIYQAFRRIDGENVSRRLVEWFDSVANKAIYLIAPTDRCLIWVDIRYQPEPGESGFFRLIYSSEQKDCDSSLVDEVTEVHYSTDATFKLKAIEIFSKKMSERPRSPVAQISWFKRRYQITINYREYYDIIFKPDGTECAEAEKWMSFDAQRTLFKQYLDESFLQAKNLFLGYEN